MNAEVPMEPPRICILGAGFSGICAGVKLQKELDIHNFTIFEKNEDFGGVWFTHTYPGCACDVPSYVYSFSFEQNADWSLTYSPQPEILQYLKGVAHKYDLYSKTKFQHEVKSAIWDESTKMWKIVVLDMIRNKTYELTYDIIIIGVGGFGNPNIPETFRSFKGPMMHSSKWNSDVDLENKVVAVVGSGASAVQIISEVVPKVKKLICFQRNPAWVPPKPVLRIPLLIRKLLKLIPHLLWLIRLITFLFTDLLYIQFYKIGGIFPSFANSQALSDPNKTEVVRERIISVADASVFTEDGGQHQIDVLILATGYKVQMKWAPLIISGRDTPTGQDVLAPLKAKGLQHYLGIMMSPLPNAFLVVGPNSSFGHNSVICTIECSVDWIIKVIREKMRRNAQVVSVKKDAEEEYKTTVVSKLKNFVWGADKCSSWYDDEYGNNQSIFPGNALEYWFQTRKVNFSKLNFE